MKCYICYKCYRANVALVALQKRVLLKVLLEEPSHIRAFPYFAALVALIPYRLYKNEELENYKTFIHSLNLSNSL